MFGTLVCTVALHRCGLSLDIGGGWNLSVPWNHNFSFDTRGAALVTLVLLGAAVAPISTAHRLGRSERTNVFTSSFLLFHFFFRSQEKVRESTKQIYSTSKLNMTKRNSEGKPEESSFA